MRFVKARLTASFLHEFVIYTCKPKNTITFHIIVKAKFELSLLLSSNYKSRIDLNILFSDIQNL